MNTVKIPRVSGIGMFSVRFVQFLNFPRCLPNKTGYYFRPAFAFKYLLIFFRFVQSSPLDELNFSKLTKLQFVLN